MGFFRIKDPPGLTQDLVQRVWDLTGRIEQLEDRLEAKLDDLAKRYRRAEQSESRLEKKKGEPCLDCPDEETDDHPSILALKRRQGKHVSSTQADSRAG